MVRQVLAIMSDLAREGPSPAELETVRRRIACGSAQVAFVDENRTVFGAPTSNAPVASPSNPITGTVTIEQMPSTATCAEVRTIN